MTVIVISGGLSHERDVSLRSGRRITHALEAAGLQVVQSDVNAEMVGLIESTDEPVVVPMLHGGLGENGALRDVFDLIGVPYVGANGPASRITFDKSIATPVVASAGVTTPRQVALPHDVFRELGAEALMKHIGEEIGFPLMVKPTMSGSALGATKVGDADALPQAMVAAYAYGQVAVIEEFVDGTEVAVTVLETADGLQALPPVEIRPNSGVYDYEARYTAGATRFVTPAQLLPEVLEAARQLALDVHTALGLRHLSRTDIMVRPDGTPVFIEGNVAPGMTETSLAPLAIEAARLELGAVFAQLVALARR